MKKTTKKNVETIVTVASAVVVTAAYARKIVWRYKKVDAPEAEIEETVNTVVPTLSPEYVAFVVAQDVISQRMLDGYYDDMSNADVLRDYDVIYSTHLSK